MTTLVHIIASIGMVLVCVAALTLTVVATRGLLLLLLLPMLPLALFVNTLTRDETRGVEP